uniref:Uncharacterized protein n=1 Tax=Tanacetum cinerariifolium TaxID=118510 RepID=A0A6L2M3C0_TANCI|nr:hypothetical protein [Tanacetum cinerariifolium]
MSIFAVIFQLAENAVDSGGDVFNLIGDVDPTDEDGDIRMSDSTCVSASLDGEIFSGGKKFQESNIGDSDNTGDGGKIVGGEIGACSGGIATTAGHQLATTTTAAAAGSELFRRAFLANPKNIPRLPIYKTHHPTRHHTPPHPLRPHSTVATHHITPPSPPPPWLSSLTANTTSTIVTASPPTTRGDHRSKTGPDRLRPDRTETDLV